MSDELRKTVRRAVSRARGRGRADSDNPPPISVPVMEPRPAEKPEPEPEPQNPEPEPEPPAAPAALPEIISDINPPDNVADPPRKSVMMRLVRRTT
jgi:hypothetical protein